MQAIARWVSRTPGPKGTPLNLNYYDDAALQKAITPVVVRWLRDLIATGLRTDVACCIGTGKNLTFLKKLNDKHGFFGRIILLSIRAL
ncbi:MAG: DUF4918 family protein [Flavobacteriales bacterium]|nr:DUF4918 family protein [Flavobacteriales bacterium]